MTAAIASRDESVAVLVEDKARLEDKLKASKQQLKLAKRSAADQESMKQKVRRAEGEKMTALEQLKDVEDENRTLRQKHNVAMKRTNGQFNPRILRRWDRRSILPRSIHHPARSYLYLSLSQLTSLRRHRPNYHLRFVTPPPPPPPLATCDAPLLQPIL